MVGGRPMRSSERRRSNVILSASAEGLSFSCSSRARMKLSMGVRIQFLFFTFGSPGLTGARKAQWALGSFAALAEPASRAAEAGRSPLSADAPGAGRASQHRPRTAATRGRTVRRRTKLFMLICKLTAIMTRPRTVVIHNFRGRERHHEFDPLPARNERGEDRGEGKPTADTPALQIGR